MSTSWTEQPDQDGDAILGNLIPTGNLQGADVLVLIRPDYDPETTVRQLQKIIDWIDDPAPEDPPAAA